MDLQTCSFTPAGGWTKGLSSALDSERTLVFVFGAPEFRDDDRAVGELRRTFPRSHMLGCSTAGEIAGVLVNDHSLSVAIVRFAHSDVEIAAAQISGAADSFAAGARIGGSLPPDGLRAVFVLSDGLKVNGSELVKGLNASLPAGTVVTGGLAADGDRFERTWVLHDGRLQSGVIVAAGLYGDRLRVGHGSRGGWDSFGPERRVTRAAGNVLYELDGKPALSLYKEYLGERAAGLPATGLLFPLSIRLDTEDAPNLVRTILAVDEAAQSMTFAGDIPQGCMARLMRANFDRLVNGASIAADQAAGSSPAAPTLAVAISCVGRRLVLGERIEEETEVALEHLPPGTQQVGFYSYGEISPYASGSCDLHNQTMTLTTIAEC
ncbi:FIST signal transduction protein [Azospira restricta]|uniref:FIST C-terminal domain-containing protein n=1 Tax=Azospira restricta TaxID=404405 RepID=A0A974PY71_9RHOO|nr:FIST N-terminal domain-containing protein [Azospira restricta]QRJ63496.1 FIST C-terminal domain-containing protein [Azospira restricta]